MLDAGGNDISEEGNTDGTVENPEEYSGDEYSDDSEEYYE